MDICEYTNVICPVCKRDDKLEEKDPRLNGFGGWLHVITCRECGTIIHLPCGD